MKSAGDYALLHANGTPFREIVEMIRVETLEWKAAQDEAAEGGCAPPCVTCWQCPDCGTCTCGNPPANEREVAR